jgi:hypothetical protein
MSEPTNLTELAEFFPDRLPQPTVQRVTLVPSLLPGETIEQAVQRRKETAARIEAKLAAKRAARGA